MAATFTVSEEVKDILKRSTITENRVVLPPEQLDRKLYEAVNKALVAAGGKWNRKEKAHLFSRDPREQLGLTIETGKAENRKQKLQAFYTPPELAERVADLASRAFPGNTLVTRSVLEPSAGHGTLVQAVLDRGSRNVTCIEKDLEAVEVLERLQKDQPGIFQVHYGDFIASKWLRYDAVVMNPPFTRNQDIDHVTHALLHFKTVLVAIMSPTWQTKTTKKAKAFRERLESYDWEIEEVPAGTFKKSGTDVATVILVVKKEQPRMTCEIEVTPWAQRFKVACPSQYREALELVQDPELTVSIHHNNEAGEWQWSITANRGGQPTDFWLSSFPSEEEALDLCEEMGWEVV